MPAGYQSWDAAGNLIMDTSTIVGRFFGTIDIGGAGTAQSGSVTDTRFADGEPFYIALNHYGVDVEGYGVVVSFTGTTMTWAYPRSGSTISERSPSTIVYGVHTL